MTREEQIINAATDARMASAETLTTRGTHHSIDDVPFVNKMITYDEVAENAFIKGAEWADNHPKSPWISVEDDLPCYHPELMRNEVYTKKIIVLLNDGRVRETDMSYDKWSEYRKKITHWQPFIELSKE